MNKKMRQHKNKYVKENQIEGSRHLQNSQRKKTNLILNILIIIVTLLICASLYFVFLATDKGGDTIDTGTKMASSKDKKEDAPPKTPQKKDENKSEKDEKKAETSKSNDPNVKVVTTKEWPAVGTEQTGNHVNSYDSKSKDWQEKMKAFSEATGIEASNMTLWFVGRGSDPATESIGTISEKSSPNKAYRVYIVWRDKKGWQPVKVEELKTNDKR